MIKKQLLFRCILLAMLLLSSLLLLSCCGLPKDKPDSTDDSKISIVATIFPPYDFARQIGGDNVELRLLIAPGVETHSYSPSPQDIIAIKNCDVFIYGGGSSDTWLDDLLDSIDLSDKQVVRMMDCVDALAEELVEGMEEEPTEEEDEHGHEHGHEALDEHVWTSPRNAIRISESICSALQAADSAHSEVYQERCQAYTAQLEALDEQFRELIAQAPRQLLIFGDRFPLRYFVEEYGLDYYAAFIGCSTETEPSAATVAFLIDKIQQEQIPVVFKLELSNGNICEAISADTGAAVRVFQSCHNLSKDDFDSGATYITLMQENLIVLEEALY